MYSMKSQILSSFANQTRLQLLICLSQGWKNVTQLIENCGLSQSAVSQHLEKLRSSGLVTTQRRGREVYYRLAHPKSAEISQQLLSLMKEVNL